MQQVLFRIYEVSTPTAVPKAAPRIMKPVPSNAHAPLKVPPTPPRRPRPPMRKCEVLAAYSRKRYCTDPSVSKIT